MRAFRLAAMRMTYAGRAEPEADARRRAADIHIFAMTFPARKEGRRAAAARLQARGVHRRKGEHAP